MEYKFNTAKLVQLSLLTALSLIIFIVELRLPNLLPLPGVKLGLANIITVYAVYHYSARDVFLMLTARIILGSVFSGSMVSLAYSLSGGVFCLAAMLLLHRAVPEKYLWLSSIGGAVCHNIGQLAAAVVITGTWGIIAYFPLLFLAGTIAGAFTGGCAQFISKRLNLRKQIRYAQ